MSTLKDIGVSAVVAALVVILAGYLHISSSNLAGGTTIGGLDTYAPSTGVSHSNGIESDTGFWDAAGAASSFLGSLAFGSTSSVPGYTYNGYANTCNTASSTEFDIVNPEAATSTVKVWVSFSPEATSTTLYIGTTTKASGLASSDISPTLANAAVVATATSPVLKSGATTNLGNGQISSGSGTLAEIVVGPKERIGMYATSTYGNAGAINYTQPGCTYKLLFNY